MRRALPWAVAAALLLALAAWLAPGGRGGDAAPAPPRPAPAAARDASPVAAPGAPQAEQLLELHLLPQGASHARADGIRLGLAYVGPDDARSWQAWVAGGQQGAGPASYAELAQVQEWRTLRGELRPDGVVVARVRVPRADRYELQARGEDALHFYVDAFAPDGARREIAPRVAAGLRLRGAAAGAALLLRRSADLAPDPAWQSLLAREAPALLAAFDEAALPVEDGALLAPLPPGRLDAVLLVRGIEAERQPIELAAGRIAELRFDPIAQAVAGAVAGDLQLEFVEAGSAVAVAELEVTWHGDRGDQVRRSDGSGTVAFGAVDRQQPMRLGLRFPPARAGALPRWPEARELALPPDDGERSAPSGAWRRRVELAPLHWLQVHAGAPLQPFHRAGGDPYPVFVLQRDADGRWRDVAADHFLAQAQGLAVSLAAPGRYRLMALLSPWTVRWSDPAELVPGRADPLEVALLPAAGHRVELSVLHAGRPLARAPLHLVGPAARLPPRVLDSDAEGRVVLEAVSVPSVTLEVPGYAPQRVDLQGTRASVELLRDSEVRDD